jgi:hypothetical protein
MQNQANLRFRQKQTRKLIPTATRATESRLLKSQSNPSVELIGNHIVLPNRCDGALWRTATNEDLNDRSGNAVSGCDGGPQISRGWQFFKKENEWTARATETVGSDLHRLH